jgi:hypothetical protein
MSEPHPITKEQQEFHAALGEAISQWAWVESELFALFARLIRPGNWHALAAAMHTNLTFMAKVGMVDAAASHVLSGDDLAEWVRLKNRLTRFVKRRNTMAHSTVYTAPQRPLGQMVSLSHAMYDPRLAAEGLWSSYTINRVRQNCASFQRLATQLGEFVRRFPPP